MKYLLNLFLVSYLMLKPLFPVFDYAVNYEYISTELCINRTQPELQCNGKCYLSQELAKSSQEGASPVSKTKNQTQKGLDFFLPADISEIQIPVKDLYTRANVIEETDYSYLFLKTIFRPPIF